ncbi:hypothetical protein TNCV_1182601 [Trichonephila clavipes]|nr:hypothetical protein TNCV_1182601 [Trichonephila clavipes]
MAEQRKEIMKIARQLKEAVKMKEKATEKEIDIDAKKLEIETFDIGAFTLPELAAFKMSAFDPTTLVESSGVVSQPIVNHRIGLSNESCFTLEANDHRLHV